MAQRRMFNKNIISSARFLRMPNDTQNLYFHLCMNADDDGVVEAFNIMRMIGSNEDNLKVLNGKEYIKILNDDLVSYITDWREHNLLRSDRKIDSMYQSLLVEIIPNVEVLEKKQRADKKDSGQPMDNQRTEEGRLGEVSLGQSSSVKSKADKPKGKKQLIADRITEYSHCLKPIEDTLNEFVEHRKNIKKPLTLYSLNLLLNKLDKFFTSYAEKIDALNESIERGWSSVFEPKQQNNNTGSGVDIMGL